MPVTKNVRSAPPHLPALAAKNKLYFGDNLVVLRESINDESVDLIYLDPPFNSNATYNVLFKTPKGHDSDAQIEAFDDTWHWGEQAEGAFSDLMRQHNTGVAEVIRALRSVLGANDMLAYLAMMAVRLLELHRVLTPTGTLYLHCDSTASHYLKIVLDQVFGASQYLNEIIWKRTTAKSQSFKRFPNNHDSLLLYAKGGEHIFNRQFSPHSEARIAQHYSNIESGSGRRYSLGDLTAEGTRNGSSGNDWMGFSVREKGNHWKYTIENLEKLDKAAKIYWPKKEGGWPRLKRYLDEQEGVQVDSVWSDLPPINSQASESLGYPTQKPLALLERIIAASSNEGEVVLDPFCGCGTAVHAAEKLKRKWIGIDVTHLAVSLVEKRLRDAFPTIAFEVHGTPKDYAGASNLAIRDKYQFQWWACSLVNAQPFGGKRKGADSGIDGLIFFQHDAKQTGKIVVSVKGGDNVGVAMIRDLGHVIEREKAAMGFLVTLAPPSKPMITEAAGAGFYTSPISGANFPKLQILTIEGLLNGTERARYPHLDEGGLTFKKTRRDGTPTVQAEMFEGPNVPIAVLNRRMAVVSTLVNRLADEPHFGRTKMAKLFYLADVSESLDLDTTYYRKAAGPLDTVALYNAETGLEAFAVKHRYLSVEKTGKKITYRRGPDLEKALDSARKVLGTKRRAVNRLIDRFRSLDTDQCEIVATLYACWNDLLLDSKDSSEESVVEEFLESWHESKRRFSRERLLKALEWMKKNQLVPTGRGAHTRVALVEGRQSTR